jgi:hypothetical protein
VQKRKPQLRRNLQLRKGKGKLYLDQLFARKKEKYFNFNFYGDYQLKALRARKCTALQFVFLGPDILKELKERPDNEALLFL